MPRLVFRNRLDADQPIQISPGAGQVTYAGLTPQSPQAYLIQPGIGRMAHAGIAPSIPRFISTPLGRVVHTGRVPVSSVSGGGGGGTGNIFNSGWENGPTGTSGAALTDNSAWTGGQGGGVGATNGAICVDDFSHSGTKSIRMTYPSISSENGPDFRVQVNFASQSLFYIRWYQYFSSNYYFRQSDHKMMILGQGGGTSQDLYVQLRGNSGNTQFRMNVHVPNTGVPNGLGDNYEIWECLSGNGSALGRGTWHRFEARIDMGAAGGVQLRANGSAVAMSPIFTSQNLSNLSVGIANGAASLNFLKWDTTYNGYADSAVQAATPFQTWVDTVSVGNVDWIGA